jgi:phosphoribosylformimino-5-aminoimidazole carboxamide ribonucleotide (ProFAR) isomerase
MTTLLWVTVISFSDQARSPLTDIRKLHKAALFDGVIIGKAIYDKSISLNELKKFV